MPPEDKAYLSVIAWPDSLDESARVEALAAAAGMDPYLARQRVRRGVPQVFARVDPVIAPDMVRRLVKLGVTAFAPTRHQLAGLGEPSKIKRLVPAVGSPSPMYSCEMWRASGAVLRPGELSLIIRARLIRTQSTTTVESAPGSLVAPEPYGMEGRLLMGGARGGPLNEPLVTHTGSSATTEILDLYSPDGSRLRIDADKFSFDVLGDERGMSDRQSMDALALRLAKEAPGAAIDTGFDRFRCPPDIVTAHAALAGNSTMRKTDNAPLFEFYSPWAFLRYRTLERG